MSKKATTKINASLDDEAFKVGDFIQELGKIQEQYFDALWEKVKENNWIENMSEETARDWLFDYCFNGWEKNNNGFEQMFSERVQEYGGETIKDKERLDFVLKNCNIEYDKFYKTSFENRDEIDEVMQESI